MTEEKPVGITEMLRRTGVTLPTNVPTMATVDTVQYERENLERTCDAIDALHEALEAENAVLFDEVRRLKRERDRLERENADMVARVLAAILPGKDDECASS